MYKYEMDPTKTVGPTERTLDAGQTVGRTEWNQYTPQQLHCAGGIIKKHGCSHNIQCTTFSMQWLFALIFFFLLVCIMLINWELLSWGNVNPASPFTGMMLIKQTMKYCGISTVKKWSSSLVYLPEREEPCKSVRLCNPNKGIDFYCVNNEKHYQLNPLVTTKLADLLG